MSLAGTIFPAVAPVVGTLLAGAIGSPETEGLGAGGVSLGLEGQMAFAELEMQDPAFWEAQNSDWQRDTLVVGLGMLGGLLLASQVFGRK